MTLLRQGFAGRAPTLMLKDLSFEAPNGAK